MPKWSNFIRNLGTAGPATLQGIYDLGFALRSELPVLLGKYLRVDVAQAFTSPEKAQGRSNLGLGTMSTQAANAVAITGGTVAGAAITGGTISGAAISGSTVAGYQPLAANLTSLGALSVAADTLAYGNGANSFALTPLTAFARTILDDANAAAVRATIGALPDTAANLLDATFAPSAAPTKKTAINGTAITAGQTRSIIMPDRDVPLGALSWELVSSVSLTGAASGAASFNNLDTLGFKLYKIEVINAVPATGAVDIYLENSTNNGVAYGATADVNWGRQQQTVSATTLTGLNGTADTKAILANNIANTAVSSGVGAEITASINAAGRSRASFNTLGSTGANEYWATGGAFFAAATNAFRVRPSAGNWTSGQVNLYGIR